MARKPKKEIEVRPSDVQSSVEGPFNYAVVSKEFLKTEEAQIAATTDPVVKKRLMTRKLKRYVDNAHTLLHISIMPKLIAGGVVNEPLERMEELKSARAEITHAIAVIEQMLKDGEAE
ncbi:MAG: hypothetical protein EBR40_06210 [Proteobacteria bacterium]|nr:hypothetical protein [Pseudomonadota bacterium]